MPSTSQTDISSSCIDWTKSLLTTSHAAGSGVVRVVILHCLTVPDLQVLSLASDFIQLPKFTRTWGFEMYDSFFRFTLDWLDKCLPRLTKPRFEVLNKLKLITSLLLEIYSAISQSIFVCSLIKICPLCEEYKERH